MRFWTEESALAGADTPTVVREAVHALIAALSAVAAGDHPRLVSIAAHADQDDDIHQYEVVVELAPGVVLPAECGLMESVREYGEQPYGVDDIVEWTMEGVEACLPILDGLSDRLDEVRRHARRVIGRWSKDGIQSHLIEARLAPHDAWRGSGSPAFTLMVEGLDERLLPVADDVHVAQAGSVEDSLREFRHGLAVRLATRAELAINGASGTVDQLALNAIAHFGDVAETLRRFGREWRFWLPDSTCLLMRDGDVTAGNGKADPDLHLGARSVTVVGKRLPETVLVAATGRPVTEIVTHPFLSDDMTVIEALSEDEDGLPSVTFRLAVRRWFFCSATGRRWPEEEAEAHGAPGNVVALRAG